MYSDKNLRPSSLNALFQFCIEDRILYCVPNVLNFLDRILFLPRFLRILLEPEYKFGQLLQRPINHVRVYLYSFSLQFLSFWPSTDNDQMPFVFHLLILFPKVELPHSPYILNRRLYYSAYSKLYLVAWLLPFASRIHCKLRNYLLDSF